MDTGFCPKCIEVEELPNIKEEHNISINYNTVKRTLDDVVLMKKEEKNRQRRKV